MPQTAAESVGVLSCPTCGGTGAWNATRQDVVCRSCGNTIPLPPAPAGGVDHFPLRPRLPDRPDSGRDWQPRATHLRCRSCQSLSVYDAHIVGGICAACGTPGLVPSDETGAPVTPSGILPFRVSEGDAREKVGEWLRANRRRGAMIDSVRAAYVPCWVFKAAVSCRWRGEIRKTRDGVEERIGIDGIVERSFDDYLIPASTSFDARRLASAGPFPIGDMRGYDTRYLAGWTVEVYTTNMWDAWDAASGRMQRELDAQLRDDSDCSPSELETWPVWSGERCAHVLVPAHAITYRHGKKMFDAVVNGWTGEVSGSLPANWLLTFGVLALVLAAAGGILYLLYRLLF